MLALECTPKAEALKSMLGACHALLQQPKIAAIFGATAEAVLASPTYVAYFALNTEFDKLVSTLDLVRVSQLCDDSIYTTFYNKVRAFGLALQTKTGVVDPTAPFADLARPPAAEISILTLAKWGLVIGIGYIAYKWITAVAHTSDDYLPRSRTPRYAGGTRKLT